MRFTMADQRTASGECAGVHKDGIGSARYGQYRPGIEVNEMGMASRLPVIIHPVGIMADRARGARRQMAAVSALAEGVLPEAVIPQDAVVDPWEE